MGGGRADYDPNQARAPAGTSEGGRWVPMGGETFTTPDARTFHAALRDNTPREHASYVTLHPIEHYATAKTLLLSQSGKTGAAVMPDGDIQSVFSSEHKGREVMRAAIAAGGNHLDCFDGKLPGFYSQFGFRETGRLKWDDRYAPPGWDYDKFDRPDVVLMALGTKTDADADGVPEHVVKWHGTEEQRAAWDEACQRYIDEVFGPAEHTDGGPGSGNFGHAGRPGLVGGSASISDVAPIKDRVWDGRPVELMSKPTKQEQGRIGEALFMQVAGMIGFHGIPRKLHEAGASKACDVQVGKTVVEVKTGMASNTKGADKWRVTYDTSKSERAWLNTQPRDVRLKFHRTKVARALQRKAALVKSLGKGAKAVTVGIILDTDRNRADVFRMPGHHAIIRWRNAAPYYVGSFSFRRPR